MTSRSFTFPFKGLTKTAYILFVARIINRAGDFVSFFLTLYLTRVLEMQLSRAGMVVTAVTISGLIGGMISGKISDVYSRKVIMLSSQSMSAIIMFFCGLYPNSPSLPIVLIISYFFQGAIRPASYALVTDLTPAEDRAKVFGLLYLGINIGVSIGPIVAGFLFESYRRWIFWGNSIATLISVLLILHFVHEPSRTAVIQGSTLEKPDASNMLKAFFARPTILSFFCIMIVTNYIYSQVHFALPLLVDEFFGPSGPKKFGILMSVNAFTVIILTPLIVNLVKERRPGQNMSIGAICYAIGFGCLAIIPEELSFLVFSTIVWTCGEILFAINVSVFRSFYTPSNHRARFASIDQLAWGIGAMLSPITAGWIAEKAGIRGVWPVILALSIVVTVFLRKIDRSDAMRRT